MSPADHAPRPDQDRAHGWVGTGAADALARLGDGEAHEKFGDGAIEFPRAASSQDPRSRASSSSNDPHGLSMEWKVERSKLKGAVSIFNFLLSTFN
jgi:hypothetical protein